MWSTLKILTIVATLLSCPSTQAVEVKHENSLYGPYQAGGANLALWDLTGVAQLADTTIRLSPDEPWKQGAIWNSYPVLANDWEFHMQFHIHGKGVHQNGDGLAIWYVKDRLYLGPVYGSKDHFSGLGIFIDTRENHANPLPGQKRPYLSAVINNGSRSYQFYEAGAAGQIGGCHVPIRNLEWPSKIAISYISQVLTVYLDAYGKDAWTTCFIANDVHLPTGYFFGVSASTGQFSDNHDVILITTLDMMIPDKIWQDKTWVVPHVGSREDSSDFSDDSKEGQKIDVLAQVPPEVKKHEVKDEEPVKRETKHETHEHMKESEVFGIHEPAKPEVKVEHEKKKPDIKKEPEPAPSASFFTKCIYVIGICVILFVAFSMFRKYYILRKERMQKRLY